MRKLLFFCLGLLIFTSILPLQGDIELNINSSINWYLGTDGNTPELKYDLVTVVLHEICHGLGFFNSMNTDVSSGWFGIRSKLNVYRNRINASETYCFLPSV